MYDIHQLPHPLIDSLSNHGIQPEQVTDLILTHLHFDHTGGTTSYNEHRKIFPTLPNATVHVQKSNWDLANQPSEKDRASYLPENYQCVHDAGLLRLVSGEQEILPGITLLLSNGHTIGQQLVKIGEGKDAILYCGDLVPTRFHLPIPWVMGYDLYPMQTIAEKKVLLPIAAQEEWTLVFEHDPQFAGCKIGWTEQSPVVIHTIESL